MHKGICDETFLCGIICDVAKLISEIEPVDDPVGMISVLPDVTLVLFPYSKRETSFHQLSRLLYLFGRSDEDMNVVGHNDKTMQ